MDGIADMETDDMLMARAQEVMAWLQQIEEGNILIVGHGSFGGILQKHILNIPFSEAGEQIPNAEIVSWI
jgi:broad specificity phosphatase PhoE